MGQTILIQGIETPLKMISSTGARYSSGLQRLDDRRGYQNSTVINCRQGDMPHCPVCPLYANLSDSTCEAAKYGLHIATLLHRDAPDMILLIDPDQEVLVSVVPGKVKGQTVKHLI